MRRTTLASFVLAGLALTACGGDSTADRSATVPATVLPTTGAGTTGGTASGGTASGGTATDGAATNSSANGGESSEPSPDPADEASGATTNDQASATVPEPGSEPEPSPPVATASPDSPLPELAVRRVNGDGGQVQLQDLVPSDRPVLVWFWAPH